MLFVNPFLDTFRSVDLRTGAYDIPPQEILTRDSVTISVDAVVYYQVSNPLCAICNNDDFNRSTRLLAQTTLRNILGTKVYLFIFCLKIISIFDIIFFRSFLTSCPIGRQSRTRCTTAWRWRPTPGASTWSGWR